jgi:hypothetical protein
MAVHLVLLAQQVEVLLLLLLDRGRLEAGALEMVARFLLVA